MERTAQWEQTFENIRKSGTNADTKNFIDEVTDFVKSVIALETDPGHHREPISGGNNAVPKREPVGRCPRCGKNIYEGKKNFYCESGCFGTKQAGCGFTLWKQDRFLKSEVTRAKAVKLLSGETVKMKAENKKGEVYEADYVLEDTGKYVNLKRIAGEKKIVGVCPRCGKNVIEGRQNFYCESGRDGCGFAIWKEDRYNGITVTADDAEDFLKGRTVEKTKETLSGESLKMRYRLVDTGKYVNIRSEVQGNE